ncbi:MAG: asparagine synthetase B (glutamine-hydrolyzing) [Myxococcota bacterium]|jgi:asparagine synthetase B (glutamine-hydrolysing)
MGETATRTWETDLYGQVPLYIHYLDDGNILVDTTVAGLYGQGAPRLGLDPEAVVAVLTGVSGPATSLFRGISRVPPGVRIRVANGQLTSERRKGPEDEVLEQNARPSELRTAVTAAAKTAFGQGAAIALAGGLDSGLLALLLQEESPPAYTVRMAGPQSDAGEVQRASQVAKRAGLAHTIVEFEPASLIEHFVETVRRCEAPILDLRPIAKFRLARRVRADGLRRLISGAGADAVFFGRPSLMIADDGGHPPFVLRYRRDCRLVQAQVLHDEWVVRGRTLRGLPQPAISARTLALHTMIPSDDMPPEIRPAASVGLSMALPYLDPNVVRVACRIPIDQLVVTRGKQAVGKVVLRQEFSDIVPQALRTLVRAAPMFPYGMGTRRLRHRWASALDQWLSPERIAPLRVVKYDHIGTLLRKYQGAHVGVEWLPFFERTLLRLASLTVLAELAEGRSPDPT